MFWSWAMKPADNRRKTMNKITAIIAQLHAAIVSEPDHLGVLYQVQGNLMDRQGERVFHNCLNRKTAEHHLDVLRARHPGKSFRIVTTIGD